MRNFKKNLFHHISAAIVAALSVTAGPYFMAVPAFAESPSAPAAAISEAFPPSEAFTETEIFSDSPVKNVNAIWNNANGAYTWNQSAQYNNGKLLIKGLPDGMVLYEFKGQRGLEGEDSVTAYDFAGILNAKDTTCSSELVVDNQFVKLTFTLQEQAIIVTQTEDMPVDISGEYKLTCAGEIDAAKAGVIALIENIAPPATSLNKLNRPYTLEVEYDDSGKWAMVTAVHTPDKKIFARYKVARDLSKVYRLLH